MTQPKLASGVLTNRWSGYPLDNNSEFVGQTMNGLQPGRIEKPQSNCHHEIFSIVPGLGSLRGSRHLRILFAEVWA